MASYLLYIAILLIGTTLIAGCPETCVCKWKGGKQTTECLNKGLFNIPDGIDQNTQVLDLTGNNLRVLTQERFLRLGLVNLQRIYLSDCRLTQIDARAFYGLTNLVELDLSKNLLSTVPSESFTYYKSLMRLTLSGNQIEVITSGAFKSLQYLTSLELTNCEIEKLDDGAFSGLYNLEWLKLNDNKIKTIGGTQLFPKSLHGIDLHDNPWNCDCNLLHLRTFLLQYNIPNDIQPKCTSPPRLAGDVVKDVEVDDFACIPQVSPATMFLETEENSNVTLPCKVIAHPDAKITWYFQRKSITNETIINTSSRSYYIYEDGNGNKQSELFISKSNQDDNGTFICVAENIAGKASANFTLSIIVSPPVLPEKKDMPVKYVLVLGGTLLGLIVVILLFICCFIIYCSMNRRRRRLNNEGSSDKLGTYKASDYSCNMSTSSSILGVNGSAPREEDNPYGTQLGRIRSARTGVDHNPDIISDAEPNMNGVINRSKSFGNHNDQLDGEITRRDSNNGAIDQPLEAAYNPIYTRNFPKTSTPHWKTHFKSNSDEDLKFLTRNGISPVKTRINSIYNPNNYSGSTVTPNSSRWDYSNGVTNPNFEQAYGSAYPDDFGLPRSEAGPYQHADLTSNYTTNEGMQYFPPTTASTLPRNYGGLRSHNMYLPRTHVSGTPTYQSFPVQNSVHGQSNRDIYSEMTPAYGTVRDSFSDTSEPYMLPPEPYLEQYSLPDGENQYPVPSVVVSEAMDHNHTYDEVRTQPVGGYDSEQTSCSPFPESEHTNSLNSSQDYNDTESLKRTLQDIKCPPPTKFASSKFRVLTPHPDTINESPDEGYEDGAVEGTQV